MDVMAARLTRHGEPLDVREVELAEPSDDDVLVDLAYAAVNPVDRYAVAGLVAGDGPLPRTIGGEGSGLLDGRPVIVYGEGLGSARDGTFAQKVVAPRAAVFDLPPGVVLDEAAGIGVVGSTAWRIVEIAGVGPDDRVLVLGASGGVGQSAVSYAASKGAVVWGQTTNATKTGPIEEFGAEHAVVADAGGLADDVRDFAPTVVLDPLGGEFTASALSVMARHGRLVLFGTSAGAQAQLQLQHLYRNQIWLLTYGGLIATRTERREATAQAIAAVAEGRMRIRVGARLPLERVNDALAMVANRAATGKVVLELGG